MRYVPFPFKSKTPPGPLARGMRLAGRCYFFFGHAGQRTKASKVNPSAMGVPRNAQATPLHPQMAPAVTHHPIHPAIPMTRVQRILSPAWRILGQLRPMKTAAKSNPPPTEINAGTIAPILSVLLPDCQNAIWIY